MGRSGTLSVSPNPASMSYPLSRSDVQALWSNEHALAWHLGEDFRADPVAWARAECLAWEALEDQLPNFLEEVPDCPCTLAQARADSSRFHVSPSAARASGDPGSGLVELRGTVWGMREVLE